MNTVFKSQKMYLVMAALAVVVIALLFAHPAAAATLLLIAPAGVATLEEIAAEIKTKSADIDKTRDTLMGEFTDFKGRLESREKVTDETKRTLDELLTKFNATKLDLDGIQQKLTERSGLESKGEKSWGEKFVESKSYTDRGDARTIRHELKAVTSAAAGVGLIRSQRENDIVSLQREGRVMRDLLPTVSTQNSSVDYAVQATRTNNAAPVAEAAAKPYSDYTWTQATVVVRTLAHLAKITRQAMDDAPRLMGEIDSEMRYGLGFVEERQFLYGTGVGQNLTGIMPLATAFARPAGFGTFAGATRLDVLRVAALQASLALFPASGIVMSQLDWALIELAKTTDGAYLFSNPQGVADARMWGLPVVATPAMTNSDFLVGDFRTGATVYDRMAVEVLISTENADDFEKNLATMRAEERVAIAVKRPGAFVKGTFTTAIAAMVA